MNVRKTSVTWKIYRTRFLIKARQLTQPLLFVDALGREHRGQPGDYLVESSDGARRIAPRLIFEDVYVAMGLADELWPIPRKPTAAYMHPNVASPPDPQPRRNHVINRGRASRPVFAEQSEAGYRELGF